MTTWEASSFSSFFQASGGRGQDPGNAVWVPPPRPPCGTRCWGCCGWKSLLSSQPSICILKGRGDGALREGLGITPLVGGRVGVEGALNVLAYDFMGDIGLYFVICAKMQVV